MCLFQDDSVLVQDDSVLVQDDSVLVQRSPFFPKKAEDLSIGILKN